jgi:hypothetical protein
MLMTCALLTSFSAISACWIERAVWSQPPPGAAGAMIFQFHLGEGRGREQGRARDQHATAKASNRQRHEHSPESPEAIKGRFCRNVQCSGGRLWPNP